MLSYLAAFDRHFGPLRVLHYITVRTLLAAGTAALVGFLIGPWLIVRLRRLKIGQHYDDDRTGDLATAFDKKRTPDHGRAHLFFRRARRFASCGPPPTSGSAWRCSYTPR